MQIYFSKICKNHTELKTELGIFCSPCADNWFRDRARQTLGDMGRANEIKQLFYLQAGKCPYTGLDLTIGANASLDHKIPRAKGGSNNIENLQWILTSINLMKSAILHSEFIDLCKLVANFAK